jgi:hypothetical protein
MSNNKTNLKSMTTNLSHQNLSNISTNANNTKLPNQIIKKLKTTNSISNPAKQKLHGHQTCEILADQNSNSNSDESSETSSADSAGDQRMDAAESLLSIANTPTTEFKAFLASNSNHVVAQPIMPKQTGKNFEIVMFW